MPLAQRILSTTTLGLLLCTLAVFGVQPVQAGHGKQLSISEASWDGNTLTVAGGGEKDATTFVTNAATPFQELGNDTAAAE